MILSLNKHALLLLTAAHISAVYGWGEMFQKPHKTHTMHQRLCIPDVDIVECDRMADGSDADDIMYENGDRMIWWDEYSVTKSANDKATVTWTPKDPNNVSMKIALPTAGMTSGDETESRWVQDGFVVEDGITYPRWTMRFYDLADSFSELNENTQFMDIGLLPDRFEYLEKPDGQPYVIRQYSGQNEDTMYEQIMFMETEELTEEEMMEDAIETAMHMAGKRRLNELIAQVEEGTEFIDSASTTSEAVSKAIRSGNLRRRAEPELEIENNFDVDYFEFESPNGCLEDSRADRCLGISAAIGTSAASYRVDAVLRDRRGRSAELFGELVLNPADNSLVSAHGGARGCSVPGQVKVGSLAELSVTTCMSGDLMWEDGQITGRLEVSAKCEAEIQGFEASVELLGGIEVQTDRGRFDQFAGYAQMTVEASILALAVQGRVETGPTDRRDAQGWVTRVYVNPSVEYNLFFFSGSAQYTFRLAEIGPMDTSRVKTEEGETPRAPRTSLPSIGDDLMRGEWSSNVDFPIDNNKYYFRGVETRTGNIPEAAISRVRARSSSVRFRGAPYGMSLSSVREGSSNYFNTIGSTSGIDLGLTYLDDDEWIVRVAAFGTELSILQLVLDTNKGRTIEYIDVTLKNEGEEAYSSRKTGRSEWVAMDGYALYGLEFYMTSSSYLKAELGGGIQPDAIGAIRPAWGKAPEVPCTQESGMCLSRESSIIQNLQCVGWPVPSRSGQTSEERCLAGNDLGDGKTYVYNHHRNSDSVEPECPGECWCCSA